MAVVIGGQEFYTAEEVCTALGVRPSTMEDDADRGWLEGRQLYPRSAVDALRMLETNGRHNGHGERMYEIPLAESWIPFTG